MLDHASSRFEFLDNDKIRPVVDSRFNGVGEMVSPWLAAGVLARGIDGLLDPIWHRGASERVMIGLL